MLTIGEIAPVTCITVADYICSKIALFVESLTTTLATRVYRHFSGAYIGTRYRQRAFAGR